MTRLRKLLLAVSTAAFLAGVAAYPLRNAGFSPEYWLFYSFPAFAHALFFTALLCIRDSSVAKIALYSIAVLAILIAFEVLQHPNLWQRNAAWLPQPILEYAEHGTFDVFDIAASVAGVLVSSSILVWDSLRR